MNDYNEITEAPGQRATREQIERLVQRYFMGKSNVAGERILEVACGSGMGLEYLANHGRAFVVGGEMDPENLRTAHKQVRRKAGIALARLDAQALPFADQSLDTVVCFEAIYYFPDAGSWVAEAHRILRKGGTLVIATVNPAWPDFHPSPFSTVYYGSGSLYKLLSGQFNEVELFGGIPARVNDIRERLVSLVKRVAVGAKLIPGSLAAREKFKRIFCGPMLPLPASLDLDAAPESLPVALRPDKTDREHKILYAICRK